MNRFAEPFTVTLSKPSNDLKMSDSIKHECGIAMIRLRQPLSYYKDKYGTALYGINKLHLMMQKQRNRGQDGSGIATIKIDHKPGRRYISRKRSNQSDSLKDIFGQVYNYYNELSKDQMNDPQWLKDNVPFMGELLLGHLRYGTHGANSIESVHPFIRQSNWINRNFILAGNFNLTNVKDLFEELVEMGQYPKEVSDTVTILEKIGHFLDDEVQRLHTWFNAEKPSSIELNNTICKELNVGRILSKACRKFDGGYVMAGMFGHGDAFVLRDPNGIRPAFYYQDKEVVVVASERPAIQTAFKIHISKIKEVKPGHALIIKADGKLTEERILDAQEPKSCSFERVYFSRGTDRDIYLERKEMGKKLIPAVLKAIDNDLENTVFSYIPNTAETSFYGLVEGLKDHLNAKKTKMLLDQKSKLTSKKIEKIMQTKLRIEKIIVKDAKIRTFIADDKSRGDLVSHIYDVTYGIVKNDVDQLVLIDDSIVRGTTLKQSILSIVARLRPKKIIVISSAPQIRYPDCYGIDMSRMGDFVAFRALVDLLKSDNKLGELDKVYKKCKKRLANDTLEGKNEVAALYDMYSTNKITKRITKLLTPDNMKPEVQILFQTLEGLHESSPNHTGDWYFSGNYPTPGGNKVVNKAFINYMEGSNERGYC